MSEEVFERASADQRRRRRLLMKLAAEQDNLCFYCDELMELPDPERKYANDERNAETVASFDHVIPRSKNGRAGANLVIAHRSCNSSRDVKEIDEPLSEKLVQLNERRKHLFDGSEGKTPPANLGILCLSSIVLADKLDNDVTPRQRGRIMQFCQGYAQAIRALRGVKDSHIWQYLSNLVLQDYVARLRRNDLPFKTYIESILRSVRMNDMRKRFEMGTFKALAYDPNDFRDDLDDGVDTGVDPEPNTADDQPAEYSQPADDPEPGSERKMTVLIQPPRRMPEAS